MSYSTHLSGTNRAWRNSRHLCALSDADRLLGHIVMIDQWHAYDAIHPNDRETGFTHLGSFANRTDAKTAVEESVGGMTLGKGKLKRAGAGSI